jgi:hypothetical protein
VASSTRVVVGDEEPGRPSLAYAPTGAAGTQALIAVPASGSDSTFSDPGQSLDALPHRDQTEPEAARAAPGLETPAVVPAVEGDLMLQIGQCQADPGRLCVRTDVGQRLAQSSRSSGPGGDRVPNGGPRTGSPGRA